MTDIGRSSQSNSVEPESAVRVCSSRNSTAGSGIGKTEAEASISTDSKKQATFTDFVFRLSLIKWLQR